MQSDRVGGGLAPAVPPHHRTYSSVYGGSDNIALRIVHCQRSYGTPSRFLRISSATSGFRPSFEASAQDHLKCSSLLRYQFGPSPNGSLATVASADFCQPILAPYGANSTRQIGRSPRVRHVIFAPHTRRIYIHILRMTIGLRPYWPSRPDMAASYALPVRRAGVLLTASFGFRFASDTLAVRLTVPIIRVRKGFSPSSLPTSHHGRLGRI